jgi:hypothetical protein
MPNETHRRPSHTADTCKTDWQDQDPAESITGGPPADPNTALARSNLAQAGGLCLHREEGREATDRAVSQFRFELGARLTKKLAGDQSRCKDGRPELA